MNIHLLFLELWNKITWFISGLNPSDYLIFLLTLFTARFASISNKLINQQNQLNLRPYLIIEGLSVEQLTAVAKSDSRNVDSGTRLKSYAIFINDEGESISYNINNIGTVPARKIKHSLEVFKVDKDNKEEIINTTDIGKDIEECLFPGQYSTRVAFIGKNIFIEDKKNKSSVRLKLKITYQSSDYMNHKIYFYEVQLNCRTLDMGLPNPVFNVLIEKTDEGIIKN